MQPQHEPLHKCTASEGSKVNYSGWQIDQSYLWTVRNVL